MRLDFVEIAGFRSSREKLRVEFGSGFTVITGRNGVGKSTIIDAMDFALTGSINKYRVEKAKGGGLAEHIWWVGEGTPEQHFVRLGVIDQDGQQYVLSRFRDGTVKQDVPFEKLLINESGGQPISLRKLSDTTILRDELISELSLDLTEQARFAAVLEAIAPVTGPDLTKKVGEVASLAASRTAESQRQLVSLQTRLAQKLEDLASARNRAAQSPNADAALTTLRTYLPDLPANVDARRQRAAEGLAQLRLTTAVVTDLRPRMQTLAAELSAIDAENLVAVIASLTSLLEEKQSEFDELQAKEEAQFGYQFVPKDGRIGKLPQADGLPA